jgi:chemotaxis protein methyltransferase CheR
MNAELDAIVRVMRDSHGIDISMYDSSFLANSVEKRVSAASAKTAAAYAEALPGDDAEAEAFADSLNITYSEFFRNSLTFALLEQLILPSLIEHGQKTGRAEIRVWSAGCAAGQEPYSVAMLLDELLSARGDAVGFRFFATDRSDAELASARKGAYDRAAVGNVRLRHIRHYFTRKGETYQVIPRLRERIAFSVYDLLDGHGVCPPVSIYGDFDLVICSNLLFYYRPGVRQLVLDNISSCLAPHGYLMTGEAERAIVQAAGGFRALAPPAALFRKRG